jgi:hypothetical protein
VPLAKEIDPTGIRIAPSTDGKRFFGLGQIGGPEPPEEENDSDVSEQSHWEGQFGDDPDALTPLF